MRRSHGVDAPLALPGKRDTRPQLVEPKVHVAGLRFELSALVVIRGVGTKLGDFSFENCKAPFERLYLVVQLSGLLENVRRTRTRHEFRSGAKDPACAAVRGGCGTTATQAIERHPFQSAKIPIPEPPKAHSNRCGRKAWQILAGSQGLVDLLDLENLQPGEACGESANVDWVPRRADARDPRNT